MMKNTTFKIKIVETLAMVVDAEAATLDEAMTAVEQDYKDCKYVLDEHNFIGAEFIAVSDDPEKFPGYTENREAISQLSVTDLIRISDLAQNLKMFVPKENKIILDDFDDIMRPIDDIIEKLCWSEEMPCPRCGGYLHASDLPQYGAVCVDCDENFY